VRRGVFVSGALAACALPLRAVAQTVSPVPSATPVPATTTVTTALDVSDLVARIPGITGVVARTMGDGPPVVAVRADEKFASASVIKLAIMATVYRAYDAGTAKPSDTVKTRASDLIGGSDVLAGSPAGKEWSLDTLVKAMIHVSDNSASNTLITAFGMSTVNATMQLAGMTRSRLGRHFADVVPSWRVSENVITPADTAGLLFAIERGAREGLATIATPQSCRAMIDVLLGNDDTTKIVRGLPPGTPCAHKTGEIDFVRNDAGIVDPFGDAPYVLVVLTRKLRSYAAGNAGIGAIAHRVDAVLRHNGSAG
jgi:beta-lactamase class A